MIGMLNACAKLLGSGAAGHRAGGKWNNIRQQQRQQLKVNRRIEFAISEGKVTSPRTGYFCIVRGVNGVDDANYIAGLVVARGRASVGVKLSFNE